MRVPMKELTLVTGFRHLGVLSATDLDELLEEVRPRHRAMATMLTASPVALRKLLT